MAAVRTLLAVIDVPVWVSDWVHECCGEARRVGDLVDIELTFAGDTASTTEPDHIDVLDDGRVSITGSVVGPVGRRGEHTGGTLIASGAMRFGLVGDAPAVRVRCVGELSETRHGYPSGVTRGELVGIRWRPAVERRLADGVSVAIDGFEPGEELSSTEDRPSGDAGSWAFLLTVRVDPDVACGSHDGPGPGE
jgi:hypothetical protein